MQSERTFSRRMQADADDDGGKLNYRSHQEEWELNWEV